LISTNKPQLALVQLTVNTTFVEARCSRRVAWNNENAFADMSEGMIIPGIFRRHSRSGNGLTGMQNSDTVS